MRLSSKKRILYVDDDRDSCELMSLMLTTFLNTGCQIMTASTPCEAASLMQNDAFDLYILDYTLPDISGVELCRRIREVEPEKPIMFYSGMALEEDKRRALKAGANEYLVKPNDLDKLVETVENLLQRSPAAHH